MGGIYLYYLRVSVFDVLFADRDAAYIIGPYTFIPIAHTRPGVPVWCNVPNVTHQHVCAPRHSHRDVYSHRGKPSAWWILFDTGFRRRRYDMILARCGLYLYVSKLYSFSPLFRRCVNGLFHIMMALILTFCGGSVSIWARVYFVMLPCEWSVVRYTRTLCVYLILPLHRGWFLKAGGVDFVMWDHHINIIRTGTRVSKTFHLRFVWTFSTW